jgi:hypothetical protein
MEGGRDWGEGRTRGWTRCRPELVQSGCFRRQDEVRYGILVQVIATAISKHGHCGASCRAAMWPAEQQCGLQSGDVARRAAMWLAERRCGLQSGDVACRAAMWPAEQWCGLQSSDVACRAAMWPAEQRCGLQNSQCGLQGSDVACRAVVWPPEQRCGMQMRKCTRTPPSAPPLKTSLLSPTRWQSEWNKAGQPLARPPAAAPPPPLPIA